MLKRTLVLACSTAALSATTFAQGAAVEASLGKPDDVPLKARFTKPVRLTAGGEPVRVEAPGYACPSWADVDGDGVKDLVVGQFAGGKMKVYRNLGDKGLAAGEWLESGGKVAEVPGVW